MQGFEEREHNGIHVVRLHYEADPAKRKPEWKANAQLGLSSSAWEREYEINWTIASGLPVWGQEFVRDWHVAKEPLLAYERLTIYRGWDFGLQPACVWAQVDAMGRLNVLEEMVTWTGKGAVIQHGIEWLAPEVVKASNDWYPGAEFKDWADPAGWQKAQTDEKTAVGIMNKHGIYPNPGPVTWTERRERMSHILNKAGGGRAAMLVSPHCTMIVEGFAGAYRYEQIGQTERYKESVEKNAWSHPMNALEYVVGGVFRQKGKSKYRGQRIGKPVGVTGY
jgi:hypothetical protein